MTSRMKGDEPVLLLRQGRPHERELHAEPGEPVARRRQIIGSAKGLQLATELLHSPGTKVAAGAF